MYFVVYLIEPKVHVVIPREWIFGSEESLWDKFVNNGLNRSQTHICYWASEDLRDCLYYGYPGPAVLADFNAPLASILCKEATYTCKIVHFRGTAYFSK